MPEGTLQLEISGLGEALSGLLGLLGKAGGDGEPATGLAGAAALSGSAPVLSGDGFALSFEAQLGAVFKLDPQAQVERVARALAQVDLDLDLNPQAALWGFVQRIEGLKGSLAGDFLGDLQKLIDTLSGLTGGAPASAGGALEPLINQLLGVLGSLDGDAAEKIQAWIRALEAQVRELRPLFEAAAATADVPALVLQVFRRTLDQLLAAFGYGSLRGLFDFLEGGVAQTLPASLLAAVGGRFDAVIDAYGEVQAAVGTAQLGVRVGAAVDAVAELKVVLRPVLAALRRSAHHPFARPRGLELFLRRFLDQALAVQVTELQQIDDPFKDLLDRLDQAVEAIDLSFVSEGVLAFFADLESRLEGLDPDALTRGLEQRLAEVESALSGLESGVDDLSRQIGEHFDTLVTAQRGLFENLGQFAPDGSFTFHLEADLRKVLGGAQRAISGDPDHPEAASVSATLNDLRDGLSAVLAGLGSLLQPVESAAAGVTAAALGGIEDFTTFLDGLDVPGLMAELRGKIEAVLDALAPIDFSPVVDPVVEAFAENGRKLAEIDPEQLNDLLRAALATALDAVIKIDFTVAVSAPLGDQMAQVKALPAGAIATLQESFESALQELRALSPEALLQGLVEALGTVHEALERLDPNKLLQPLDEIHERLLLRPLAALDPASLLAPLAAAFDGRMSAFDGLSGAALIAPLVDRLDQLRAVVEGLDLAAPLDRLLAVVTELKQDLRGARPSALLAPVADDLSRLEAEFDRFKPSLVMAPVVDLAAPLLSFLDTVQQDLVTALFELFRQPLADLDRLDPAVLAEAFLRQIDSGLELARGLDLAGRFRRLKGVYFDLDAALSVAPGSGASSGASFAGRVKVTAALEPEVQLGSLMAAYGEIVGSAEGIRGHLDLSALAEDYGEFRQRLLGLLPPFARQALDVDTFRRVMRLASPLRFVDQLDARFETIKAKLLPLRPAEIGGELDAVYERVLAKVEALDPSVAVAALRDSLSRLQALVGELRVDFVAADIDAAIGNLRAVVEAADPARLAALLDGLRSALLAAAEQTVPSTLLSDIGGPFERVRGLVESLDPEAVLAPARLAWEAVEETLAEIDFRLVLAPLVAKLDELEAELVLGLKRSEDAFDGMLSSARGALGAGANAGASASVGGSL